jgi:hypothetical protein
MLNMDVVYKDACQFCCLAIGEKYQLTGSSHFPNLIIFLAYSCILFSSSILKLY